MTHERIVRALVEIVGRAPRPGIGLRGVLLVSPEVVKESKQVITLGGWSGVGDLYVYREFGGMRWRTDPTVAFARVELEEDPHYKPETIPKRIVWRIARFMRRLRRKELKCL